MKIDIDQELWKLLGKGQTDTLKEVYRLLEYRSNNNLPSSYELKPACEYLKNHYVKDVSSLTQNSE